MKLNLASCWYNHYKLEPYVSPSCASFRWAKYKFFLDAGCDMDGIRGYRFVCFKIFPIYIFRISWHNKQCSLILKKSSVLYYYVSINSSLHRLRSTIISQIIRVVEKWNTMRRCELNKKLLSEAERRLLVTLLFTISGERSSTHRRQVSSLGSRLY